jgi:glycosyltransferase involved in cell wall biosynthesis
VAAQTNRLDTVVLAPAGYLVDPEVGSDPERPWRLAAGLAARGYRVVIVARTVQQAERLGSNVVIAQPQTRAPRSPLGKILDRVGIYMLSRAIARREVATGRVLVVHHVGPCSPNSPSLVGTLPVPFIYGPMPAIRRETPTRDEWLSWLGARDSRRGHEGISRLAARATEPIAHSLWRRTLHRADCVTVEARANAPKGIEAIAVIPPGADPSVFRPGPVDNRVHGRLIAVGRLEERKRYDVLIRAIARVARTSNDIHLVLVGTGPQESALRDLANDLRVGDRVTFAGHVDRGKLPDLLCTAIAFCHPSSFDTFPLAVIEAMACGLPALVSSVGAMPEIVGNGGLVHAVGNDEDLSHQVVQLLKDPQLRSRLSEAARNRVVTRFNWERMCDDYVALYERLRAARAAGLVGTR